MGERWGSLGELTASVASKAAAPARAHLHAIRSRQRGVTEENSPDSDKPIQRDSKRVTLRIDRKLLHMSCFLDGFYFQYIIICVNLIYEAYSIALH